MAPGSPYPRDILVGELRREYTLSENENWTLDAPGGCPLYAAAGYLVWEQEYPPGLSVRVGENYPQVWLDRFAERGIDTSGVVILPQSMDLRACILQEGGSTWQSDNPLPHLTRLGISLPSGLVGFNDGDAEPPNRQKRKVSAISETDIPDRYLSATGVHFCPLDYLSHNLLPAVFRQHGFTTVTLDPGGVYMDPSFLGDLPALVTGLTAFLPAEEELRQLYKGVTGDVWEMAADLGHYGCELVVIKRGQAGQYLYETATDRRWEIAAYPARVKNPYGAGNAFCGGFLAGFRDSLDPLEAVVRGSAAASLAVEGAGAFYPLDALPGLVDARLDVIRRMVREI